MIEVTFFFGNEKKVARFRIVGHAPEYICSAISVLAINTINCLEKFTDDDFFYDYDESGGFIDFKFVDVSKISHDARLLIDVFEFGCRDVARRYFNHVSLSEVVI